MRATRGAARGSALACHSAGGGARHSQRAGRGNRDLVGVVPIGKDGEANAKPWISHFWLVLQHDVKSECQMDLVWETASVGEFSVSAPLLVNRRQVSKGEVLKRMCAGTTVRPAAKRQRKS